MNKVLVIILFGLIALPIGLKIYAGEGKQPSAEAVQTAQLREDNTAGQTRPHPKPNMYPQSIQPAAGPSGRTAPGEAVPYWKTTVYRGERR